MDRVHGENSTCGERGDNTHSEDLEGDAEDEDADRDMNHL